MTVVPFQEVARKIEAKVSKEDVVQQLKTSLKVNKSAGPEQ